MIGQKFLAGGLVVVGPPSANPTQALARCGMIWVKPDRLVLAGRADRL